MDVFCAGQQMLRYKVSCSRILYAGKRARKGWNKVSGTAVCAGSVRPHHLPVSLTGVGAKAMLWASCTGLLLYFWTGHSWALPKVACTTCILKYRYRCAAMPKGIGYAQRCISDLAFYFWPEHRSLAQQRGSGSVRGGSHCVLTGGDVTQTCCWELRDSLSWQEFHRNGHRKKKDARHRVIDSWWCRNLCNPIKTQEPPRALHVTGSYHCPSHPVFCSVEDFLLYWLLFCPPLLFSCCMRMKWLKRVCKPEMLIFRNIIIISFGRLIGSLN